MQQRYKQQSQQSAKKNTPPAPQPTRSNLSIIGCVISGILLGLMLLTILSPESGIPKVHEVTLIKTELEREIQQLDAENTRLIQEIDAMQNDPFWQEKIAREELNMALPGEIIYKFSE